MLNTGAVVDGHTLGPLLGSGGLALVFESAEDPSAAIKLGRERGGSEFMTRLLGATHARGVQASAGELRSFAQAEVDAVLRAEAKVLEAAQGAAGLPRLLAQVEHGGRPVLILERLQGPSLLALRNAGDPLPLATVSALARALAEAARAGSLPAHGELKLGNLILEAQGDARLRPLDPRPPTPASVVSPAFYPLLRHDPGADAAALCACLYAFATGKDAFPPTPAPARARSGNTASLRGHLALCPQDASSLPQGLATVLQARLGVEGLLCDDSPEHLDRLADALDACGVDALTPPAPVALDLPPPLAPPPPPPPA